MNFAQFSLLTGGVIAALLPLPAQSDPDPLIPLGRLDVEIPRIPAAVTPTLDGARSELYRSALAGEAFSADRFLRGRASTVEDTFALSPGIIAQSRFGSDEARLSIRGSGLQRTFHGRGILLLQDGVPLNLADGSFDMQALEPLATDFVAVRRGATAAPTGASTLGGTIDYVSWTAAHSPAGFARLEAGSWGYRRIGSGGGGISERYDGYAVLTHQAQEGFRDHAAQRNTRLFSNAGVRLSPTVESRTYFTVVDTDSELPGTLTRAQLESTPRRAAAANTLLDQRRDFQLLRLANKTTGRFDHGRWECFGAWTYKDLHHPIFQVIDQLSNDGIIGASVTRMSGAGEDGHRFSASAQLSRGEGTVINSVNAAGSRAAKLAEAKQVASNAAATVEQQLALGHRWTAVASLTGVRSLRKSDGQFGPAPDYRLVYDRLLPRVALRWGTDRTQLFLAASDTFEPPSFSEALTAATPRRAQTARTVELGYRGSHRRVNWDATLYTTALKDELLSIDHDQNPSTPAVTTNADATSHAGAEIGLDAVLLGGAVDAPRLVLRGAWTYGRFRFDRDPTYGDTTLAGLPPHVIRAELSWEHAEGFYSSLTSEWVPQRTFIDFRNTFSAAPHALVGCRIGYRRARGWSYFVDGRNLTDERYAATTGVIEGANHVDQAQFLPGDGRSVFAGVDYRW